MNESFELSPTVLHKRHRDLFTASWMMEAINRHIVEDIKADARQRWIAEQRAKAPHWISDLWDGFCQAHPRWAAVVAFLFWYCATQAAFIAIMQAFAWEAI